MNVLLFQLDGALPNVALMRLAAHHKALGDTVLLERTSKPGPLLWGDPGLVYVSLIFEWSRPAAEEVRKIYPGAIIGGTGWDLHTSLEQYGVTTREQDYSLYPECKSSIGFTQRGCRLNCSFCVVPKKEGRVSEDRTIYQIWRGDPWPRELLLLDNDFFGQVRWRDHIRDIREGGFAVCFTQGINARFLSDEAAEAVASVDYRDSRFKERRIYTAWDNRRDEERLFAGLDRLVKYGVRPDDIMVYILCGYCHAHRQAAELCPSDCQSRDTHEDRDYRRMRLREFGARPYPMPYTRSRELVGFQRWVIGAYDKRVGWEAFCEANYQPCWLGQPASGQMTLWG